jgi:hypothetical protein
MVDTAAKRGQRLLRGLAITFLGASLLLSGGLLWTTGHPLLRIALSCVGIFLLLRARLLMLPAIREGFAETDSPLAQLYVGADRRHCPQCAAPTLRPTDDSCLLCEWPDNATSGADARATPSKALVKCRADLKDLYARVATRSEPLVWDDIVRAENRVRDQLWRDARASED